MFRNNFQLFIFLFFTSATVFSQEHQTGQKFMTSLEVFNNLKQAKGLLPDQKPILRFVEILPNDNFVLAMANNETGEIFIQERTYDICTEFMGKDSINGLAFILAHELAHYTKQHYIRHQFIEQFQAGDTLKRDIRNVTSARLDIEQSSLDSLIVAYKKVAIKYRIRKNEAEADLEAGFTSYLAGYESIEAGPKFLDLAYRAFRIENSGGNYASLEERKEIVKQTGMRLDSLVHIFEMGNYLSVAGAHHEALECYDYVATTYQSKELYNNIGVLALQQISQAMCGPLLDYALPITLDLGPEMVFKDKSAAFKAKKYIELKGLFRKAIDNFNKSSSMDHAYYIADLNKSIAYVLMHSVDENFNENAEFRDDNLSHAQSAVLTARKKIQEADEKDDNVMSNIFTQLAIVSHARKELKDADKFIETALELNPKNQVAITNKGVFAKEIMANREFLNPPPNQNRCVGEETVFDDLSIQQLLANEVKEWEIEMKIKTETINDLEFDFFVRYIENEKYKIYQWEEKVKNLNQGVVFNFFETKSSYDHPSLCNVQHGQSLKEISDNYGNSSSTLETATGSLIHYMEKPALQDDTSDEEHDSVSNGIIFKLNGSQGIDNWVLFTRTENP